MDLCSLMAFWCLILTVFIDALLGKVIYSLQKTGPASLDYKLVNETAANSMVSVTCPHTVYTLLYLPALKRGKAVCFE